MADKQEGLSRERRTYGPRGVDALYLADFSELLQIGRFGPECKTTLIVSVNALERISAGLSRNIKEMRPGDVDFYSSGFQANFSAHVESLRRLSQDGETVNNLVAEQFNLIISNSPHHGPPVGCLQTPKLQWSNSKWSWMLNASSYYLFFEAASLLGMPGWFGYPGGTKLCVIGAFDLDFDASTEARINFKRVG